MGGKRRGKIILIKGIAPRASTVFKLKYILKVFKERWKDTYWWKRETSRYILQFYYRKVVGNDGIYVAEEEWDNLIILDACRYDVLREVMGEDIDYRISRGSHTLEWIRENFTDEKHNDIVYVTGNPWVNKLAGNSFYKIISVWKDGWDDDLDTVDPKTMTEYAKEAAEKYPDRRLVVHYMQPHAPYIAENNIPIRKVNNRWEHFMNIERGKLDPQVVWDAYRRSLEATLPHVFELVSELKGRTVISADHGELFGRKILFFTFAGHLCGVRVPELVQVPWVVFEGKERKEIQEGDEKERLKDRIGRLKDKGRI